MVYRKFIQHCHSTHLINFSIQFWSSFHLMMLWLSNDIFKRCERKWNWRSMAVIFPVSPTFELDDILNLWHADLCLKNLLNMSPAARRQINNMTVTLTPASLLSELNNHTANLAHSGCFSVLKIIGYTLTYWGCHPMIQCCFCELGIRFPGNWMPLCRLLLALVLLSVLCALQLVRWVQRQKIIALTS